MTYDDLFNRQQKMDSGRFSFLSIYKKTGDLPRPYMITRNYNTEVIYREPDPTRCLVCTLPINEGAPCVTDSVCGIKTPEGGKVYWHYLLHHHSCEKILIPVLDDYEMQIEKVFAQLSVMKGKLTKNAHKKQSKKDRAR